MAITYPLAFPTYTRVSSFELTERNAVAMTRSPFTFDQDVFHYSGEMWEASVTLPPMRMGSAAAKGWGAFLTSLKGSSGRFMLGDLDHCNISGTATSATITGSAGDSTVTVLFTSGQTLLAGDMIQIGSASDATLHKVLADVTSNGSETDLEIWPALRKDRSAVSVTLANAQGVFRLAENSVTRTRSNNGFVTISFAAMEAV